MARNISLRRNIPRRTALALIGAAAASPLAAAAQSARPRRVAVLMLNAESDAQGKARRALGLGVPASLLVTADETIE